MQRAVGVVARQIGGVGPDQAQVGQAEARRQFALIGQRLPVVLVSHDVAFVSSHLKRIACLNRRLVCHTASEVTAEMLAETYEGHTHLSLVQHTDDCPTHPEDDEVPESERWEPHDGEGPRP